MERVQSRLASARLRVEEEEWCRAGSMGGEDEEEGLECGEKSEEGKDD